MSTFSRQHYNKIANVMQFSLPPESFAQRERRTHYSICRSLCLCFANDNARFKPDKFMEACGWPFATFEKNDNLE
jgi:hypothetical protein